LVLKSVGLDGGLRNGVLNTARRYPRLTTSQLVLDEFEAVITETYRQAAAAFARLGDQQRPRLVTDMWTDARPHLSYQTHQRAATLEHLALHLGARFADPVSPLAVIAWLRGSQQTIRDSLLIFDGRHVRDSGDVIDRSTCCHWKSREGDRCTISPARHCRLAWIAEPEGAETVFVSAQMLATRRVSEASGLQRHLAEAKSLKGIQLLGLVGSQPDAFCDVLIYWEVPESWSLLTRDRAFFELQKVHPRPIQVLRVRPTRQSGRDRQVTVDVEGTVYAAELRDWTDRDCSFLCATAFASRGLDCVVRDLPMGPREARIRRKEATQGGRWIYGARFKPVLRSRGEVAE
jgi:hypothetical protein